MIAQKQAVTYLSIPQYSPKYWLLIVVLLISPSLYSQAQDKMVYRYWDWGKTLKRDNYQFEVLTLALEKTLVSHGSYSLSRIVKSYSTPRVRREINLGETINIRVGPWLPASSPSIDPAEINLGVDIPLAKNLLGYRNLIIRKEDLPIFNRITTINDLKKLVIGQGRGWIEIEYYRAAGFKVEDSADLDNLFSMLVTKRFDYLPMSVIEVPSALDSAKEYSDSLATAPNIFIYYPLPIIFYVSSKHPELAERVKVGLLAAKKDGSLDSLFERYFTTEIKQIKNKKNRIFKVRNIHLPPDFPLEAPLFSTDVKN